MTKKQLKKEKECPACELIKHGGLCSFWLHNCKEGRKIQKDFTQMIKNENKIMTQKENSWEEEFDEKFPYATYGLKYPLLEFTEEIKSFISNLLSQARIEERQKVVGELLEKIIELKEKHKIENDATDIYCCYEEAVRDFKVFLTNLKNK